MARSCEALQASLTLLDTTTVDMAIGLVGTDSDWNSSVFTFDDVTQTSTEQGLLDTTEDVHSLSLQSGLITLVVKGDPKVFASPLTSQYYLEVEHLTTMHFLDPVKFATIKSMMSEGVAYNVFSDPSTGRLELQLSQKVWDTCTGGNGGSFSCAVRQDISKGVVRNEYAVHPFATGIGSTDLVGTRLFFLFIHLFIYFPFLFIFFFHFFFSFFEKYFF